MADLKVDSLSKDERAIVVAALELKAASVARAAKAESNPSVVEIRVREGQAIQALIIKFS